MKTTFNAISPTANEPDIVETIQRQNDHLSKQVAQVENENNNLQASVTNLKQQISDKDAKKEELASMYPLYFVIMTTVPLIRILLS